MIFKVTSRPITKKQSSYIEVLAIDLGFDREQRNAHISTIVKRSIKFLDELTLYEAQLVISTFKELKETVKVREMAKDEPEL